MTAAADGTLTFEPPVELRPAPAPSTTGAALTRKFHDNEGAIYEYSVRVSTSDTAREKQAARLEGLWREHERRHVEQLSQKRLGEWRAVRRPTVFFWLEVLSAGGFGHDRLYVEWSLRFRPETWRLRGPEWLLRQHVAAGGAFDGDGFANVRSLVVPCVRGT